MAGNELTDVDVFTDPVVAPGDLEPSSQAVHARGLQALANRTRNLLNQIGTLPTDFLVANRIYGRASAGNTEGKASTDFSLALIALGTAILHADAVHTKGNNIASATTTNIAGATGMFVHITGTTQIDALGTAVAGVVRYITFDAVLTLSHNASIILPTSAAITTAADDFAVAISEGAGVWRVASYERASGEPLVPIVIPAGLAGGQSITGGTAASENLTLGSTSHGTKGAVINSDPISVDGVGSRIRAGTGVPGAGLGANGDLFWRTDGAAATALYYKSGGSWAAIA